MTENEPAADASAGGPLPEAASAGHGPAGDASASGPGSAPDGRGTDGSAPADDAAGGGSADGAGGPTEGLSERDRAVLAVERRGWAGPGAKERAIRERLDISPTRYYQLLNALLDDPAALAHAPVTVNRLRRVREAQRARR